MLQTDLLASFGWATLNAVYLLGAVIILEQIGPLQHITLRSRLFGATLWLIGTVGYAVVTLVCFKLLKAAGVEPLISGTLEDRVAWLGPFAPAAAVAIHLLINDFMQYWRHRAEHRFFWRIHLVHHTPTDLHAAFSIGHPFQAVIHHLTVSTPLVLLNVNADTPVLIGFLIGVSLLYIHSPVSASLGPLRRVFVDNRFHRIHHSLEERHFEKNFGIGLSLWDQLFGTAHFPEAGEWPDTGVPGSPPPRSVGEFLAYPFKR